MMRHATGKVAPEPEHLCGRCAAVAAKRRLEIIGDLKVFEPKTIFRLLAVRDREEPVAGPGSVMWIVVGVTCRAAGRQAHLRP